jgi:YegS/Rv2252/BmrU family lipid kinase
MTEGPGHAEALAREAVGLGFQTIVAGGGDGTINEVLRGIAGSDVRLGVLPLGTMNVFARELKLPLEWKEAWEMIAGGGERRVDLGWANDMPLAQLAGVGFDAQAISRVHPELKRRLGPVAYVWAGVMELFTHMPLLNVICEGHPPMHGVWVALGTGRYYGGPFPVFPDAANGDGLLNVMVVRDLSLKCLMQGFCTLPFGWHTKMDAITYFQTRSLRVELAQGAEGHPSLELDGELRGHVPVDFRIDQNALRVAAPARK